MSEWDRGATPGGVEGPQWVSAAEAADVAGVTPGTVRYWARNGLIVSEVVGGAAGEKTLVRLDEVLAHARGEGGGRRPSSGASHTGGPAGEVVTELPARTSELAPILKSIPEIMAQLTAATDRAARAETKVEFLSAQLAEMRRRLADAEAAAGAPASEPIAVPEEWEKPDDSAAVVAEEAPAPPAPPADEGPGGVAGWPAPPPEMLHDVPAAEVSDPGPELVDWGSAAPASADDPAATEEPVAAEVSAPVSDTSSDLSLGDIWNQPAAPQDPQSTEPEPAGVDWHDPSGAATEAVRARAANAPIPDGDDFYGPRRRRWFRRRR